METTRTKKELINFIFKAVAVGVSIGALVLGILGTASLATQVSLLSLGLAALAIASL